jgi:hypothetical protein
MKLFLVKVELVIIFPSSTLVNYIPRVELAIILPSSTLVSYNLLITVFY